MAQIQGIIVWVQQNWAQIANGIVYAIALASIIVKMTPTLKDDTVLLAIIKFLGKYVALNKTVNAEDRPK